MGETINAYTILVGKAEGMRPHVRPMFGYGDNCEVVPVYDKAPPHGSIWGTRYSSTHS
jgi:hypothetical protein